MTIAVRLFDGAPEKVTWTVMAPVERGCVPPHPKATPVPPAYHDRTDDKTPAAVVDVTTPPVSKLTVEHGAVVYVPKRIASDGVIPL